MTWRFRTALVAAVAGILALGVQPALAHTPVFVDSPSIETAYPLTELTYQSGLYGSIAYPGAAQYYQVSLAEPRAVSLFLLVPNSPNCREFRPQIAVIGPGVSELAAHSTLAVPEGMSVLPASSPFWGRYSDADTRLPYFAGPRVYPELGAATYYIAVFDEMGGVGNYMLLVGDLDAPSQDLSWLPTAEAHHACGG